MTAPTDRPASRIAGEVQPADIAQDCAVQKLDALGQISLQMAKMQFGGAVKLAIKRSDSQLKEFGDESLVSRICNGDISDVLGRVWARPDTREEFVLALLKASGLFSVEPQIRRRA